MFTIQAVVEKDYELAAQTTALHDFFSRPANFSRYMPDIVDDIQDQGGGSALWMLRIKIPSGSPVKVDIEITATHKGHSTIIYEPTKGDDDDRLAMFIKLAGAGAQTAVNFRLELRLQRKSSFDVHPLAGIMGERAISKLVQSHAEEILDEFIKSAETLAQKKSKKK